MPGGLSSGLSPAYRPPSRRRLADDRRRLPTHAATIVALMDGGAGVGYWGRVRSLAFAVSVTLGLLVVLATASIAQASPPSASFTGPASVPINSPATFTSSSSELDGDSITRYLWDFGDGQTQSDPADQTSATHSYSTVGTYTVTLTVVDSTGSTSQATHQIQVTGSQPQAAFTASPAGAEPTGTEIQFDGTSSSDNGGTITSYSWNFADGSTSDLPSPSHAYATAGTYTVSLTVKDTTGATNTAYRTVTVSDRPPTAAFNPTEATVLAGSSVSFDGTQSSDPDGTISGYSWNFGDGTGSSASQPSHSYTEPGTYNATLRVTDNSGNSSSVTHQITVIAPPPIQVLVESIIPAPILVRYAAPSIVARALVDLKRRLFCPGTGPVCRTTIVETKTGLARDGRAVARAAATTVLTTPANGNAELALHLTSAQWKTLLKSHHLSLALTLVSTRGAERVTSALHFKLTHR
jgi:PKD repeat protein